MEISEERWNVANQGEQEEWNKLFVSEEKLKQFDAFTRHAPILKLSEVKSGISVCDLGGGPISLLRYFDLGPSVVVDPLDIPQEFKDSYAKKNILYIQKKAEGFVSFSPFKFDEVWLYNCLQHVVDPFYILDNLYHVAPILRISEPCETPINALHPHTFKVGELKDYLTKISVTQDFQKIDYDFPYFGGVFKLK